MVFPYGRPLGLAQRAAKITANRVSLVIASLNAAHKAGDCVPTMLRTRKPPRIKREAVARGVVTPAQAAKSASQLEGLLSALQTVRAGAKAKFDESVDVAIYLHVDVKRSDLRTRGMVTLPHGIGRAVKVAVFTKDEVQAAAARAAGADLVGAEDLIELVKSGKIDFERALATPDAMPMLAQVARILGPRGLMPNPKRGTVLLEVAAAVLEAKAGQYEFKAERYGVVHGPVGRLSFGLEKLRDNLKTFIAAVLAKRPPSSKNKPPRSLTICSTHGSSVKIDPLLF
ncbi:ribosomal protein L1-like protein [Pavlovales sp. CCMP2436]|nr:ribosomal protein L1-like protein [Pavlovales sp. CCMP2436]